MNLEMRLKLAREPFEEKIRKVAQLVHLVKTFPRRAKNKAEIEVVVKRPREVR